MKNFIAFSCALLLSASLFAVTPTPFPTPVPTSTPAALLPLPAEKLKKINDYIAASLGARRHVVDIKITKANIDESTELLTSVGLSADLYNGTALLGLETKFENNEVKLASSLKARPAVLEIGYEDLMKYAAQAQEAVDAINARGDYKAVLTLKHEDQGSTLVIKMAPARDSEELSIKKLTVKVFVPKDLEADMTMSISGTFKATAENVKNGQIALTNILTDLGNERQPSQNDLEVLAKIISDILESVR